MSAKTRNALVGLFILLILIGAGTVFLLPTLAPAESNASSGQTPSASPSLDLASMLSERSMGAPDAPVVIVENSSLTCPHCAHFHRDILPKLKTEYIDTGKVRLVLNDFPLNKPALEGSILARCLPADRYFQFIDLLFSTQEVWRANAQILQQDAKLAGLGDEQIKQCLASEDLAKGILDNMQNAQKKWKVDSTPTFVFNNGASTLLGALPYEDFKAEIEKFLTAKQTPDAPKK